MIEIQEVLGRHYRRHSGTLRASTGAGIWICPPLKEVVHAFHGSEQGGPTPTHTLFNGNGPSMKYQVGQGATRVASTRTSDGITINNALHSRSKQYRCSQLRSGEVRAGPAQSMVDTAVRISYAQVVAGTGNNSVGIPELLHEPRFEAPRRTRTRGHIDRCSEKWGYVAHTCRIANNIAVKKVKRHSASKKTCTGIRL